MDPHKILGVPKNASPAQIKDAYRQLAAKLHPDRGGDAKAFEQTKDAYRQLTQVNKSPGKIFACSECGAKVRVPQSFIGTAVKCPKCKASFESKPPAKPQATPAPTSEQGSDLDLEVGPIVQKYKPRRKRKSVLANLLMIVGGAICTGGLAFVLLPILQPAMLISEAQINPNIENIKTEKIAAIANPEPVINPEAVDPEKPSAKNDQVAIQPLSPLPRQQPMPVDSASVETEVTIETNDEPQDFKLKSIKGVLATQSDSAALGNDSNDQQAEAASVGPGMVGEAKDEQEDFSLKSIKGVFATEPQEETELSESLKTLTNEFETRLAEAMNGTTTEVQKMRVQQRAIAWLEKALPSRKQEFLFPVTDVAAHPTMKGLYLIELGDCETENGSFPATLAEPSVAVKLEASQVKKVGTDWKMSFSQRLSVSGDDAMVTLYETGVQNLAVGLAQPEKMNRRIYKLVRPKNK